MIYPPWLKIWLGVFGIPVLIGFFPFIVMYFKINGKPMWELPLWQDNKVANYLIPLPKGGYSQETWIAIRPQPILFLLVGIGYFIFYGFLLGNNPWALPLGLMVLPLILFGCYLFDFGMEAEWSHSQSKYGLIIQEIIVSAAVLVPLIYLVKKCIVTPA